MNGQNQRRIAPGAWPWLILIGALAVLLFSPFTRPREEHIRWAVRQEAPQDYHWQEVIADYRPYLESISEQEIDDRVRAFVKMGSRVHGYAGNRAAAEYLRRELRRMGYEVQSEPVGVAVPIDLGGQIQVQQTGETFPLYSLWPNLVRTSTLPPQGLSGPLVDGGRGEYRDFQGKKVEGSIVLLDFDSNFNFIHARTLGGRAVIYLESEKVTRGEAEKKFLSTPTGVPRFWIAAKDGIRLRELARGGGQDVNLTARMEWQDVNGEDLWVELPGTDLREERVVIQAYYDSMSVVPALSPGAEQAAGIVAWLKLAEVFRRHPPRRAVTLLATTAHFEGLQGISHFLAGHCRIKKHKDAVQDIILTDPSIYLRKQRVLQDGLAFEVFGGRATKVKIQASMPQTKSASVIASLNGQEREFGMTDETNEGIFQAEIELAHLPGRASQVILCALFALALFVAVYALSSRYLPRTVPLPLSLASSSVFVTGAVLFLAQRGVSREDALKQVGKGHYEILGFRLNQSEQRFTAPVDIGKIVPLSLFGEDIPFKLFISLDLSSRTDRVGIFYRGHSLPDPRSDFRNQKFFAPFGKTFQEYVSDLSRKSIEIPPFYNGISPIGGKAWESYLPGTFAFENEAAVKAGLPGISLVSVHDTRLLVDTPHDLTVDAGNLARQTRLLSGLFANILNDPDLLPDSQVRLEDNVRSLRGRAVEFDFRRNPFLPDTPIGGALVSLTPRPPFAPPKTMMGVRSRQILLSDEDGYFFHPFVTLPFFDFEPYRLDPADGRIIYAADRGREGSKNFPQTVYMDWALKNRTLVLFPCQSLDLFSLIDPRYLQRLKALQVLGQSDFAPEQFGFSEIQEEEGVVVFAGRGERIKVIMGSSIVGNQFLLTRSETPGVTDSQAEVAAKSKGLGLLLDGRGQDGEEGDPKIIDGALVHPELQVTQDMIRLDGWRIAELEKYAITNNRLSELHLRAKDNLEKAESALKQRDYEQYIKRIQTARGFEAKAYPEVIGTMQGTVAGVVFYFAILIPFAFFVERLLVGSPDIRKQIAVSAIIFVLIFCILREVHPAFFISRSPYVIFLAFVILALALFVTSFVVRKFNEQIAEIRRKAARVHQADVGRLSASGAAFMLGISNLKKRRLRTWLTTITLILLTFTVLSFTSVKTHIAFSPISLRIPPAYPGVLFRDRNWNELTDDVFEHVRSSFAAGAEQGGGSGRPPGDSEKVTGVLAARSWYSASQTGKQIFVEVAGSNGKKVDAAAAVGLMPSEAQVTGFKRLTRDGRWLASDDGFECLIPGRMAEQLEIDDNSVGAGSASVQIFGQTFRVAGIFDSAAADRLLDLDGESLAPVDVMEEAPGFGQKETAITLQSPVTELKTFQHVSLENIVILPYAFVRNAGGTLRSIAVRFPDDRAVNYETGVKEFLKRVAMTLFVGVPGEAGTPGRVTAYSSIGLSSFTGLKNLVIPILIAALIVLNTMMGAVHERQREIGVYSSVGLAPFHIGALFMAESCVFAVLGAVAGYLAGQVTAKIITEAGWFGSEIGITLNYSALSAVASTLLVMAVVMISTLYPAWMASRMAVPDVTRKWKFPEPEGDLWRFEFPFTISTAQGIGLNVFLTNYFDGYKEESVGSFYTDNVHFTSDHGPHGVGYCISMDMWLSPYDLGVSQHVDIRSVQTEDKGIASVHLEIRRLSGDVGSWKRVNQRYLTELRKQFLIWRTVPEETKMAYAEEGKQMLAQEAT